MNRVLFRIASAAAATAAIALLAAGCGSDDSAPAGAKTLSFKLTDAGCEPHDAGAPAGPITFEAENDGTGKVTELEILSGDKVLGEVENLTEGLSGNFTLTLDPGEYTIYCPGGETERGTLTVSGEAGASTATPRAKRAVAAYRAYLERNAAQLVTRTEAFADAVLAGDVERAKALYAPARVPYERIEPVAESFGDLDPRIDARENDVPAGQWGGFHRIEKALWVDGTTDGMAPVARSLERDVKELRVKVKAVELQPAQIANGANELLGEVSASKITGEEERYSHTDLVDFEANVEGAKTAFASIAPLLSDQDRQLAAEVTAGFAAALGALDPYRRADGFVSYTHLDEADTRRLAQRIDAVAEQLSQVPARVVNG